MAQAFDLACKSYDVRDCRTVQAAPVSEAPSSWEVPGRLQSTPPKTWTIDLGYSPPP